MAVDPAWLEADTIERRAGLTPAQFREEFELPNRPVILTDVVSGASTAGRPYMPMLGWEPLSHLRSSRCRRSRLPAGRSQAPAATAAQRALPALLQRSHPHPALVSCGIAAPPGCAAPPAGDALAGHEAVDARVPAPRVCWQERRGRRPAPAL